MGEPVLKEGYLVKAPDVTKHIHNFKKWQRKWFQLNTSGDLYYYDNEKSTKAAGVIHLLQCNHLFDAKSRGIQTSYCIGMDLGDIVVYVKAESEKTFGDWVKPMSEFADVCEISLGALDSRRGTLSEDVRRGSIMKEGRHGTVVSETDRGSSVENRHFSFTTVNKFLVKEGWLGKTGSNNKGWKSRYFKLSNGKLVYHGSDKNDNSRLGDIDLFKCSNIQNAPGKKGFGIDIQTPSRTYNLSADTKEDCDDWYSILSHSLALIADINDSSGGGEHRASDVINPDQAFNDSDKIVPSLKVDDHSLKVDDHSQASHDTCEHRDEKVFTRSGDSFQSSDRDSKELNHDVEPLAIKEENKDGVVQLLEAEVEALRGQLISFQADLKTSTSLNNQLQHQLSDTKHVYSTTEKELIDDKEHLLLQVSRLEKSKLELETVNDSVRTQLEEQLGKVQELEEDLLLTRQEFDESQTANTAVEEELNETQQRLQEIEAVAQQLEVALKLRESEPATPVITSGKYLPFISQAYSNNNPVSTLEEVAYKLSTEKEQPCDIVQLLKSELSQLTKDKEELADKVLILEMKETSHKAVEEHKITANISNELEEERLKWQMNIETLSRELNTKFDSERSSWDSDRTQLENDVKYLKETIDVLQSEDKVAKLEFQLTHLQSRVVELEGELEIVTQHLSQLQMQKDKAVTDLIALRKTNKSIEKRMSESEDSRVASPMNSLVNTLSSFRPDTPDTPDISAKVSELEKQVEELITALAVIEKERDILNAKLNRLTSGVQTTPDFGFKQKSGASVASSNVSTTAQNGVVNGSAHSSQADISNQDAPPQKPRRPPRELMCKLGTTHSNQEGLPFETNIRTRTASFIKSIKTMMT